MTGKSKKAEKVLEKIAKVNRHVFKSTLKTTQVEQNEQNEAGDGDAKKKCYTYLDLFRCKKVALVTLSQACLWLTSAMNYYAISLESSKLGG